MTSATRDGATNAIAIGPDDSLVDVFDRIRAAGQTPVELRIPNESPLFLTASEFRTLRDVTDHGRHEVTIHTPDPHRLQLAKLFGLEVARTPGPVPPPPAPKPAAPTWHKGKAKEAAAPAPAPNEEQKPASASDRKPDKGPAAPAKAVAAAGPAVPVAASVAGSGGADPEEVESSVSEEEAAARWPEAVVHTPTPSAPRRMLDRVSAAIEARRPRQPEIVETETEPAAHGESEATSDADSGQDSAPVDQNDESVAEGDAAVTALPRRLTLPGGRPVSRPVLIGAVMLVVLALYVILAYLAPSATVRVELASLPINSGIIFDVTTDGQPLDGDAAFALRGEPVELTVTSSVSMATTGVETIPDGVAAGSIRFANPTPVEVTIEPGTIFTTESGAEFTLVEAVVVPAADPATLAPGEVDAAIEAVTPGTAGNVETGAIGGRLENGVYYSNRQGATEGGTDREIHVVAQADLDALVAQADAEILDLVTAQVAQDDAAVVAPSLTILDQTNTFDQEAGAEANEVSLEATRTVSILTYDQAEASRLIAEELGDQLQAMVPQGFLLGPVAIGADDVIALDGAANGGRFQVDAEARATLALTPEKEAELASALAGKSPEEVEAILASWPEVASYEIEPGFQFFTSNLPANSGRIAIDDGS